MGAGIRKSEAKKITKFRKLWVVKVANMSCYHPETSLREAGSYELPFCQNLANFTKEIGITLLSGRRGLANSPTFLSKKWLFWCDNLQMQKKSDERQSVGVSEGRYQGNTSLLCVNETVKKDTVVRTQHRSCLPHNGSECKKKSFTSDRRYNLCNSGATFSSIPSEG